MFCILLLSDTHGTFSLQQIKGKRKFKRGRCLITAAFEVRSSTVSDVGGGAMCALLERWDRRNVKGAFVETCLIRFSRRSVRPHRRWSGWDLAVLRQVRWQRRLLRGGNPRPPAVLRRSLATFRWFGWIVGRAWLSCAVHNLPASHAQRTRRSARGETRRSCKCAATILRIEPNLPTCVVSHAVARSDANARSHGSLHLGRLAEWNASRSMLRSMCREAVHVAA